MGRRAAAAGLAATAAVMAVTVLAGCTQSANTASGYEQQADAAPAAATMAGEAAGLAADGSAAAPPGGAAQDAPPHAAGQPAEQGAGSSGVTQLVDDRQIIRTATVSLEVTVPAAQPDPGTKDEDPGSGDGTDPGTGQHTRRALADAAARAATRVRALAPGTGGYVSASDGGGDTISVVLRIPADSYASVMNSLDGIGRVTSRTEKTDDVTDQMVDVASRIATMKASIDRIRALLAQADKIGDVISIESELASREADLESLQNRQTALKDQVTLSTISVTVTAVTAATVRQQTQDERRSGFLTGLEGGWRALVAFGTWLGSVAGALLPFAPLIAVAVWLAVWVSRRRRRANAAGGSGPQLPGASSPTARAGDLS